MRERRKSNDDVMPQSKDIARRQSKRSPEKKKGLRSRKGAKGLNEAWKTLRETVGKWVSRAGYEKG